MVGFSLPAALAAEVKAAAARRNLPLCMVFGEMWSLYKIKKRA
jgi:hypothetical protein